MNSPNKLIPDSGKESFSHLFKTQKTTVSVFLILVVAVIFLGFWQLRAKVLDPFKAPVDSSGNIVLNNNNVLDQDLDTDGDGLSDYDEIYLYGTSPYLEDTDSDGISDYDEIKRGSDPLCKEGENCLGGNNFYDEANLTPTSTDVVDIDGEGSGLGELVLPSDVDKDNLEQALSGGITVAELRTLLLQSGADAETLEQISDEELLASYQEVLNKQNE